MHLSLTFSVLISIYRHDNPIFLKLSLASIFDQTLSPNQVVVVIDGPIPNSLKQVVDEFKKLYPSIVDIYPLEKNIGLGSALNYGLLHCRNEMVARMDSDDISLKDRFEKQIVFFSNNQHLDVLGCNVEEFNEEPGDLERINKAPSFEEVYKYSRWRNPINHPTVVFRKSSIIAVNGYENIPYFEDYFLWIKLLRNGYKIDSLQEVLLNFRNNIDTLDRRRGLKYVKHEFSFFKIAYSESYIEFRYFILGILIRLPLRLIPKKSLSLIYNYVLRK